MRLVFVSDTHNSMDIVQKVEGDILFHCGDFVKFNQGTTRDFGRHLSDYPCDLKVVIAGNHDMGFMLDEPGAIQELFDGFGEGKVIGNLTYLRDNGIDTSEFDLPKLKIWGSPWQPWFHDWAFNFPRDPGEYEEFATKVYGMIPDDTDVLLTHCPPRKIRDISSRKEHTGCRHLLKRVLKLKPKIHAFGHTHPGYGTHGTTDTLFINCAQVGAGYIIKKKPIVVDINESGRVDLVKI